MAQPRARLACCFLLAMLVAAGCVEVEVRRTVSGDGSGSETLVARPLGATADQMAIFPGKIAGGTCRLAPPEANARRAEIAFDHLERFRHQVAFLTSVASHEADAGGGRYRETILNNYFNSLRRAPDANARKALEAEMARTRAALANAKLTYTIEFPGRVVASNADTVSENRATWVLTADRLFGKRQTVLSADYKMARPEVAGGPGRPVVKVEAPRLAAPAPLKLPVAPALAPPPLKPPAPRDPWRLDGLLVAQASAPEKKSVEAPPAPLPRKPKASLEESPQDTEKTRRLKELFRQALVHIDYKRYDQAAETLQKAIALKPDEQFIHDLYEQVVVKFLDTALESGNKELKARAEALQKLALKGRLERLRDPKRIEELVQALKQGFLPRTFAIEELTLAGDYAVPHLFRFIKENTDPEERAYAGLVLSRLRGVAVPAICEALEHPDPMVRQVLIQALANIADPRSAPALAWLAQQPDGHPLVVKAAREALAKVCADPRSLAKPAAVAFADLARLYYEGSRKVVEAHVYEYLVWRYDPQKKQLLSETVPRHLYHLRVAEEMCRNALMANPDYEPAIPLLLCSLFAQEQLIETFYATVEGKANPTEEEQQEARLLTPIRKRLAMARAVAQAAGKKFVYAALREALRDGKADVAVAAIRALQEIADGSALPAPPVPEEEQERQRKAARRRAVWRKPLNIFTWYGPKGRPEAPPPPPPPNPYAVRLDGSPLVQALTYPNHRLVRYAAAEAIVAISPTRPIRGADKVMSNLAQALGETATHVALLVEEDKAVAEELRPHIEKLGIIPVLATTERDAISAATELPPKDLIILSGSLERIPPAAMLASLRRVYTMAAVPVIVVAARGDLPALQDAFKGEKVTFLTRPFSEAQIKDTFAAILKRLPEPKNKAVASSCAAGAAEALASIDPATSIFRLSDALDALIHAVANKAHPDNVRIACCKAIARAASPKPIPVLITVYNDKDTSKELKLAALETVGACAAGTEKLQEEIARRVERFLDAASRDPDSDVRKAAARAMGLMGGAPGEFTEVMDALLGQ